MIDYSSLASEYDKAEASQGFVPEPLPKGRYPMKVAKITRTAVTKNGVPSVSAQLKVTQGPFEGRSALVTFYLDASPNERNENGETVAKSSEDYANSRRGAAGRMKGFLSAIGISVNKGANVNSESYLNDFYSVAGWENGDEFIATISVRDGDFNDLSAYHKASDAKYGLNAWRSKELPAQTARVNNQRSVGSAVGTL